MRVKLFFIIYQTEIDRHRYHGFGVLTPTQKTAVEGMIHQMVYRGYDFWFARRAVWAVPAERVAKYEYN